MTAEDRPDAQYIESGHVIQVMADAGVHRLTRQSLPQVFVLAMLAGGFITVGALLSVLLGTAVPEGGPRLIVEGLAFSTGFFFVILSDTVLFTEANVVLPATLLHTDQPVRRVVAFWSTALGGNLAGAVVFSTVIGVAQTYSPATIAVLGEVIERKLAYRAEGGTGAWLQIVLSGILANWLVGMAAFFSVMGRTIMGKYIPVALAVTAFVAANFQHSPANMGYFSLNAAFGAVEVSPVTALGWNIIPAAVGNMIGAASLVALPYWWVNRGDPQDLRRSDTA